MGGRPHRILFFWHSIGNKFLTGLSNAFNNLNLTDMETCYKLFRREMLQSLDLRERRSGFEPEVAARIARIPNVRIYEVGISYCGRTYAEGKKVHWRDGCGPFTASCGAAAEPTCRRLETGIDPEGAGGRWGWRPSGVAQVR